MNDYSYYLYSPIATYGSQPTFYRNNKLPSEGFSSLYAVDEATAHFIAKEGSTRWFKGVVWSPFLHLDFDSYEAAERAEKRLEELGYAFRAFDTGGRGGHFAVSRSCTPSHLLPIRDKHWVASIFPEADLSIYTHLHPFRIEGTIHEKTGNRKRLVCERGGGSLVLPPLARETIQAVRFPSGNRQETGSIFDCFRVMANTVPSSNGERHKTLIRLIYALKDQAGVDVEVARWWCLEWDKMCSEPKGEDEIEKAIRSIY